MKTVNYLLALAFTISSMGSFAQTQKVNIESSTINWLGKKIGGQHEGTINLKSGSIEEKNGTIVSGTFVIDMTSISNTDLTDEGYNQKLVGHLKSDDFFGVENFPTATLNITRASAFNDGKASATGDLMIKDKKGSVTFDIMKKGNTYIAKVEIDRSEYNVKYGSTSFFDSLGDKAIDDIFVLDIMLSVE